MNKRKINSELAVALSFLELEPSNAARILERNSPQDVALFIAKVPEKQLKLLLEYMLPHFSSEICMLLEPELISKILLNLDISLIVIILRCMPKERQQKLLQNFPKNIADNCLIFLQYSKNEVGFWMEAVTFTLPENCLVSEAIARLSREKNNIYIENIYVTNAKNNLIGYVTAHQILKMKPSSMISDFLKEVVFVLSGYETLESVENHRGWMLQDSLPIVKNNRLMGILRHIDLRNVLDNYIIDAELDKKDKSHNEIYDVYSKTITALIGTFDELLRNK